MTSTLTMRDGVTVATIPVQGTDIAAGYINGYYQNWVELGVKFPSIPKVAIDVNGSAPGAEARDWETGDKGGDLRQWVIDHNTLSGASDAVIYCNRSTISEVRQLTGDQVLGQDYYLWIATGDGTVYGPAQLTGVIACQNLWFPTHDSNIVWPTQAIWWTQGVIAPPPPPPPPVTLPPNWTYGPVQGLTLVNAGPASFRISFTAPVSASGAPYGINKPGITDYQVSVVQGATLTGTVIDSYPRYPQKVSNPQSWQGGGLTPGTQYTAGIRALWNGGHAGPWQTVTFTTPNS